MKTLSDVGIAGVTQSMPIVTSYATLGEEGLSMSLMQSHAKAIFADPDLLGKLVRPLKSAPDVRFIIYNDQHEVKQADLDILRASHDHVTILPLKELRKLGQNNPVEPVPPSPEDLCCIMYTSGTTGTPKGVPLKHRNIVAASKSTAHIVEQLS